MNRVRDATQRLIFSKAYTNNIHQKMPKYIYLSLKKYVTLQKKTGQGISIQIKVYPIQHTLHTIGSSKIQLLKSVATRYQERRNH